MKAFHSFRLDAHNQRLWRGQEWVPITPKAFDVLRYLVEHTGTLVTQDELLEKLWPETYVNPELIKKYITEIRKVLGDSPQESQFIKTFPKRGYEFIATVMNEDFTIPASEELEQKNIVGRDRARSDLDSLLEKAGRGQRQIIFVIGEAGIGKTTLVDLFLQQITPRREIRVARGQCVEGFGGKEAYYPVLEALGELLRAEGEGTVSEVLTKQAPTWMIQFPSLLKPEQKSTLQREIMGGTRERMLRELCEALEALTARDYLCLVLEDLHWSDPSTLDLISAIARRRRPARLLVLATYRPVDVALTKSPLKDIKQDLLVHGLCSEIALERLEEAQIAQYLNAEFGMDDPSALANLIYRHSGGNALFMVTIVRELKKRGLLRQSEGAWSLTTPVINVELDVPETLQHLLDLQFEQLSSEEQQLLRTASVVGERFSVCAIAPLLERDAEGVEDICEGLVGRDQFLKAAPFEELGGDETTACYGFKHSLYRQAVYRKLSPVNRSRLHRSLGERLSSIYGRSRPELASTLALHFEEGRNYERAVYHLFVSAENSTRRFADRDAIAIVRHAQELFPRLDPEIRIRREILASALIGNAHYALGEVTEAAKAYEMEAQQAANVGDKEAQLAALSRLAYVAAISDADRGLAASELAVEVSRDLGNPALLARAEVLAAGFRIVLDGWRKEDAAICAAAEPSVDTVSGSDAPLHTAILYASQAQIFRGEYKEALRKTEAVLAAGTTSLTQYLGSWGAMLARLHMGQFGKVLETVRAATGIARRNGNTLWFAAFLGIESGLRTLVLDFEGARRLCEGVLKSSLDPLARTPKSMAHLFLGRAESGLGNYSDALGHFSAVQDLTKEKFYLYWYWRMQAQHGSVATWLAAGELTKARCEAEKFLSAALSTEDPNLQARAWEMKTRIAMADKAWVEAEEFLSHALEILRRINVPMAAWQVHATGWKLYRELRQADKAAQQQQKAEMAVRSIADSFALSEPLREIFLTAHLVREILSDIPRKSTPLAV
jgi:DNA-binding winged helix-turn-helix (wHTH) protein/tetratricopeptide (TPR) repeat protein